MLLGAVPKLIFERGVLLKNSLDSVRNQQEREHTHDTAPTAHRCNRSLRIAEEFSVSRVARVTRFLRTVDFHST